MGIKRDFDSTCLSKNDISEDEVALYDRQIRLWGIESQKCLREAKILIVGIGGLGAEIAKNIVLAGVKAVTVIDDKPIKPQDSTAQFLVAGFETGRNRAETSHRAICQLNPNVEVVSDSDNLDSKEDSFFLQFSVICATDCSVNVLYRLDKICREHSIKFCCGDTWGFYGYCFLDLSKHTYKKTITVPSTEDKTKNVEKVIQQTLEYCPLEKSLSLTSGKPGVALGKRTCKVLFLVHILNEFRDKHNRFPSPESRESDLVELQAIRSSVMNNLGFDESKVSDEMLSCTFGELSPVCAVVGGILAQEIIKGITCKEEPINNFFLFDGNDSLGVVENLGSGVESLCKEN